MNAMVPISDLLRIVQRLKEKMGWFATPEGVEEMEDKTYGLGSVHRALIGEILLDAAEVEGLDPAEILQRAVIVTWGEADEETRIKLDPLRKFFEGSENRK